MKPRPVLLLLPLCAGCTANPKSPAFQEAVAIGPTVRPVEVEFESWLGARLTGASVERSAGARQLRARIHANHQAALVGARRIRIEGLSPTGEVVWTRQARLTSSPTHRRSRVKHSAVLSCALPADASEESLRIRLDPGGPA